MYKKIFLIISISCSGCSWFDITDPNWVECRRQFEQVSIYTHNINSIYSSRTHTDIYVDTKQTPAKCLETKAKNDG